MIFRRYESLILLSASLVSEQVEAFKSKVDSILTAGGGQVIRIEEWGRKRLAYPVRKDIYGYYILYDYRARPELADELERNLSIDEQVTKYLTLVLDKNFTESALEAVKEALANEASRHDKEQAQPSDAQQTDADSDSDAADDDRDDSFADDDDEYSSAMEPLNAPDDQSSQDQSSEEQSSEEQSSEEQSSDDRSSDEPN
jgi:small subunit ribosomal protein S6